MKKIIGVLVSILLFSIFLRAVDEVKMKGLVQSWFSYNAVNDLEGDNPLYGFTIRRLRLIPHGSLGHKVKWGFMAGWDRQEFQLFEVYLDFLMSREFNLKVGQFTAPGSKSGTLTKTSKIDFVERAQVTQMWAVNMGLFGYRAFGIQGYGKLMNDKITYALMLSNSKTMNGIFTPMIKQSTYNHSNYGLAVWGRVEIKPFDGLSTGIFFGSGSEEDTMMERKSIGAHLFYRKNDFNFKMEYNSGKFGTDQTFAKYDGAYISMGYKIKKIEPVIRYGFFQPQKGGNDKKGVENYNNITLGINYFYSKKIKFQVNYILRSESMADGLEELNNNLFYTNIQYVF